jgi:hypothetical protein
MPAIDGLLLADYWEMLEAQQTPVEPPDFRPEFGHL